jgi:hypothetical protein
MSITSISQRHILHGKPRAVPAFPRLQAGLRAGLAARASYPIGSCAQCATAMVMPVQTTMGLLLSTDSLILIVAFPLCGFLFEDHTDRLECNHS